MVDFVVLIGLMTLVTGFKLDGCQPPDPNCHPSCVVYDASHCRLCRCPTDGNRDSNWKTEHLPSGSNTDDRWNNGFNGDWSQKNLDASAWAKITGVSNSWENSGNSNVDGSDRETTEVRYVLVDKDSVKFPSTQEILPSPFIGGSKSSFSFPSFPRASSIPAPPSLLSAASRDRFYTGDHSTVFHVPLIAPGQPRYCIRCHILSCPSTCERVNEYGCHSCPCAPSNLQTVPVMKDCSDGPSTHTEITGRKPDCRATQLCITTCRNGYMLGVTGRDGCRECSCIKPVPATPQPEERECPATISCMLKCKDGYVLGGKQRDGCPSCTCLAKGVNVGARNNGTGNINGVNNGNGGSSWSMGGSNKWNSNKGGGITDNKGSTNNMLSSTNGLGNGECKPPMCLDGKMSVNQAMTMGTDSANGRYTSGRTSMTSGGSGNEGNCFPMCAGGSNNQFNGGSSSSSSTMPGSGSTGSGSGGCSGPFCSTMSGMGSGNSGMSGGSKGTAGGMGMARGTGNEGGPGRPFSPFATAMSGGSSGMGIGAADAAYRRDCIGTSCSAKNEMRHKDCPNLIHCLVTCDGNTLLGDLDRNGCQTCSCVYK